MKNNKYNLIIKASALFLGIIFTLLILEVSLRIFGYIYTIPKSNLLKINKNNYTILCIGDSFTYGIGGSKDNDYPSQLEKMLNSKTNRIFKVYNRGIPNNNTTRILSKLENQINLLKPDLIIFLAGGANERDFWGYGSSIGKILYNFKVIKLIKLLNLNLKDKFIESKNEESNYNQEIINEMIYAKNKRAVTENIESPGYKSALFKTLEILRKKSKTSENCYNIGIFYLRKSNYNIAIYYFNKGILLSKNNYKNYEGLSFAYKRLGLFEISKKYLIEGIKYCNNNYILLYEAADICIRLGHIDEAYKFLENAIKISNTCGNCYYLLQKIKSIYNNDLQKNKIDSINIIYPIDSNLYVFDYFKKNSFYEFSNTNYYLKNKLSDNKELTDWINNDLLKIIDICKTKGIKLIIQNYPVAPHIKFMKDNTVTNPELNYKIAKQYNIPYVNNNKIFSLLYENAEDYFEPPNCGEHPNDKGYNLMAKNVFDEIIKNKIFDIVSTTK